MDTADLNVMSQPPFDPTADVRITHTVEQGRVDGVDRNTEGGGLILNHYLRGPSVGKGQHGTVYKCWDLTQDSVEVVRLFLPLFFPFLSHHDFPYFPPLFPSPSSASPYYSHVGYQSRVAPQSSRRPSQPVEAEAHTALGAASARHR